MRKMWGGNSRHRHSAASGMLDGCSGHEVGGVEGGIGNEPSKGELGRLWKGILTAFLRGGSY